MATEEATQQAFEAIQQLALRGKKMTKSDKLKGLFDDIHALARYQSDVIGHLRKQENQP